MQTYICDIFYSQFLNSVEYLQIQKKVTFRNFFQNVSQENLVSQL